MRLVKVKGTMVIDMDRIVAMEEKWHPDGSYVHLEITLTDGVRLTTASTKLSQFLTLLRSAEPVL